MFTKNERVSNLQITLLILVVVNSLFVGIGYTTMFVATKQDAWLIPIIALPILLLVGLLLVKIMNCKPDKNIFGLNKYLYGKHIGVVFNIILTCLMAIIFMLNMFNITNFGSTKYLIETPLLFVGVLFLLPILYAVIKGLESIMRTNELLLYVAYISVFIVLISLIMQVDIENLKPYFSNGYAPVMKATYKFLTYAISPLLVILLIPKDKIANERKLKSSILTGIFVSLIFNFIVMFICIGTLGIDVLKLYDYPEYYVIKRAQLGTFNNVQNFLAIHWLVNLFTMGTITLFFIKEAIINTFNLKNRRLVIGVIIAIASGLTYFICNYFNSTTEFLRVTQERFPLFIGIPVISYIVITFIVSRGRN